LAVAWRRRQHQRRWRRRKEWRRRTARQRQSDCSSVDAAAGKAQRWCAARRSGVAASVVQPKPSSGAQRDDRGLQRQWCNQSPAVAHSATAAARWEQRGGCGGFTGTVCEWANASAFERHRLANVRVFVLGRERRDDSVNGIVVVSTTAAPVATSTAVADAPPLTTTTPMATPTTLFVKLNLIYYYYLFIYHYIDRK